MTTGKKSKSVNGPGRGGYRAGAGRKPGAPNKKTAEFVKAVEDAGITPLEYMLNVMRQEPSPDLEPKDRLQAEAMRFEAAKAAAPYIHPRLAAIEHTGGGGGPIDHSIIVQFV